MQPPMLAPAVLLLVVLVLPTPAFAQVDFSITPSEGPVGTRFIHTVTGLAPNTEYQFRLRGPNGYEDLLTFQTALAGRYSTDWRAEATDPVGPYIVEVVTADGATVLATGAFTVTRPGEPTSGPTTLPRSGAAGAGSSLTLLLAGLGIVLINGGYLLLCRGDRPWCRSS